MSTDQPAELLAELQGLREQTRNARHAYWLPVLMFAVLVIASAPLYVDPQIECSPARDDCGFFIQDPFSLPLLSSLGYGVAGPFWLFALVIGAVTTAAWYRWYGQVTGLVTRVRGSLLSWAIAIVVLFASSLAVSGIFRTAVSRFGFTAGAPLLAIGVGLVALGILERSRLLLVVASFVTGWAVLIGLYTVSNQVYRVWSWFGVSDENMPFATADTVQVLVPGFLLLGTAAAAFVADLRRR